VTQYDQGRSYCIWFDASWRDKHIFVSFSFLYLHSIKSYWQKKRLWPRVTSGDLVGGHWKTTAPGSSRIAWYNMILRKLEWSDAYSPNRKYLNSSPLTYNGEGHVVALTSGHEIKNPRYTNFKLWWPYQILKVVKWSTNCGCGTISKYCCVWVTLEPLFRWRYPCKKNNLENGAAPQLINQ